MTCFCCPRGQPAWTRADTGGRQSQSAGHPCTDRNPRDASGCHRRSESPRGQPSHERSPGECCRDRHRERASTRLHRSLERGGPCQPVAGDERGPRSHWGFAWYSVCQSRCHRRSSSLPHTSLVGCRRPVPHKRTRSRTTAGSCARGQGPSSSSAPGSWPRRGHRGRARPRGERGPWEPCR